MLEATYHNLSDETCDSTEDDSDIDIRHTRAAESGGHLLDSRSDVLSNLGYVETAGALYPNMSAMSIHGPSPYSSLMALHPIQYAPVHPATCLFNAPLTVTLHGPEGSGEKACCVSLDPTNMFCQYPNAIHPQQQYGISMLPPTGSCLPIYFSESSFPVSSSPCPSDISMAAASQLSLSACPSAVFNPPPQIPMHPPPPQAPSPQTRNSNVSYPVVYVSPAGLLTVLMQNDIAVEMTLDRAVRVVNHSHKAVAATNSRGNASCIYHYAAKVYQDRTTTEMSLYGNRQARMKTGEVVFSDAGGHTSYCVSSHGMNVHPQPNFSDLSQDMSVTLLFSSSGYGPHLMAQYDEVAQASRYRYYRNGAVTVFINSVRVHQTPTGDVVVTTGRKHLRVSPKTGLARVVTHFVEMTVEHNWTVRIRRGGHKLLATSTSFILANDDVEFGFDGQHRLFMQPATVKQETIIYRGRSKDTQSYYVESLGRSLLPGEIACPTRVAWEGNGGFTRRRQAILSATTREWKLKEMNRHMPSTVSLTGSSLPASVCSSEIVFPGNGNRDEESTAEEQEEKRLPPSEYYFDERVPPSEHPVHEFRELARS